MNNPSLIGRARLTLLAILVICIGCGNSDDAPPARSSKTYSVGVAQSNVSVKIDLTDKLNPAILPDVMREVLQELTPTEKPDSEKFQQQVVRKLSHKIISNPEVIYRVDLNEDSNLDPLLVVPESVQGQAAVYSVRVPDPTTYPKDPEAYDVDWDQVAKTGINWSPYRLLLIKLRNKWLSMPKRILMPTKDNRRIIGAAITPVTIAGWTPIFATW